MSEGSKHYESQDSRKRIPNHNDRNSREMLQPGSRSSAYRPAAGSCRGEEEAGDITAPSRSTEGEALEKIALVGHPNVGKSVVFSLLTGRYVMVSNYPGTTVEVARGKARLGGETVEVVDTPGAGSLLPMSDDERVTRDILLKERVGSVLLVADAKNLKRSLSIGLQLGEAGLPFSVAVNMADEAASRGIEVDPEVVSKKLGVEAFVTVATRRQGMDRMRKAVLRPSRGTTEINYGPHIEEAVSRIEHLFEGHSLSARSLALMILADDRSLLDWARSFLDDEELQFVQNVQEKLQEKYTEPVSYVISSARWKMAESIEREAISYTGAISPGISGRLGDWMMHPVYGWIILALVLWGTYEFVGNFGAQVLVDLLEVRLFENHLNPLIVGLFDFLIPWPALAVVKDALVGEYGMLTMALTYSVAIILPIVTTFFLVFGILEDSGYLPRLAVMSNRFFRRMGLNGKAVLPMILGLGCGTMAVLTSRIMGSRKERVLIILLLALGVPCSAQLGVILGILHDVGGFLTLVWVGVVLLTLLAVGKIAEKLMPGESSEFVLELPPIRMPQLRNILVKTLSRMEWYLKEAVPLFMLGTFVLFVLDRTGAMGGIENAVRPVVEGWLDLPVKATQAFIVGFLRRDYGAAGLYSLAQAGRMDAIGAVVGLITITLFVPCIANFFMIIKELGMKAALAIIAFIFPFAFFIGGVVNHILRGLNVGV